MESISLWVVLLRDSSQKLFVDLPQKSCSSTSYRKPPKWWLFLCTHEIRFSYRNVNSSEGRVHETEGWHYKKIRNLYGEKNEKTEKKMLNRLLYNLPKQEDLNSCKNLIYSSRLVGEIEAKKRRVFSKIFKLDKNNQYRLAMTKPLPIGIFKKELSVIMNILNKSIKSFNPNA